MCGNARLIITGLYVRVVGKCEGWLLPVSSHAFSLLHALHAEAMHVMCGGLWLKNMIKG